MQPYHTLLEPTSPSSSPPSDFYTRKSKTINAPSSSSAIPKNIPKPKPTTSKNTTFISTSLPSHPIYIYPRRSRSHEKLEDPPGIWLDIPNKTNDDATTTITSSTNTGVSSPPCGGDGGSKACGDDKYEAQNNGYLAADELDENKGVLGGGDDNDAIVGTYSANQYDNNGHSGIEYGSGNNYNNNYSGGNSSSDDSLSSDDSYYQEDHQLQTPSSFQLTPFTNIVGGHTPFLKFSGRAICKPLNKRELQFYESVAALHPRLRSFLPEYLGVVNVTYRENPEIGGDPIPEVVLQQNRHILPTSICKQLELHRTNGNNDLRSSTTKSNDNGVYVGDDDDDDGLHQIPLCEAWRKMQEEIIKDALTPLSLKIRARQRAQRKAQQKSLRRRHSSAHLNQAAVAAATDAATSDNISSVAGTGAKNNKDDEENTGEEFTAYRDNYTINSNNSTLISGISEMSSDNQDNRANTTTANSIGTDKNGSNHHSHNNLLNNANGSDMAIEAVDVTTKSKLSHTANGHAMNAAMVGSIAGSMPAPGISGINMEMVKHRHRHYNQQRIRGDIPFPKLPMNRPPQSSLPPKSGSGFTATSDADFSNNSKNTETKPVSQTSTATTATAESNIPEILVSGSTNDGSGGEVQDHHHAQSARKGSSSGSSGYGRGNLKIKNRARRHSNDTFDDLWKSKCTKRMPTHDDAVSGSTHQFILMKDLTSSIQRPSILDLKMGTRQHGINAVPEKVVSQTIKCAVTTSRELGVRMCGLQVFKASRQQYLFQDKYYGRTMNPSLFRQCLLEFLDNGDHLYVEYIPRLICKLCELYRIVKDMHGFRFYGSSLLLVYDGIATPDHSSSSSSSSSGLSFPNISTTSARPPHHSQQYNNHRSSSSGENYGNGPESPQRPKPMSNGIKLRVIDFVKCTYVVDPDSYAEPTLVMPDVCNHFNTSRERQLSTASSESSSAANNNNNNASDISESGSSAPSRMGTTTTSILETSSQFPNSWSSINPDDISSSSSSSCDEQNRDHSTKLLHPFSTSGEVPVDNKPRCKLNSQCPGPDRGYLKGLKTLVKEFGHIWLHYATEKDLRNFSQNVIVSAQSIGVKFDEAVTAAVAAATTASSVAQ
ncbi:inositol polyphosphate kinase kcs1 [Mycoemilia scoparia]|uniref:Kinase n=1 Tax=Mycoemilia scoparia TaxID=417184 RepID=A0A9W7ZUZ3_9FUNG|nr:inositol polyphosphate kinase kcs1 [Mycoemilia scoparia]